MWPYYERNAESCPDFREIFEPTMRVVRPYLSRNAAALFIHEPPKAFGHNQSSSPELDDLDLTARNKQIKGAAADPGIAAGIVHAHADRLDAERVACLAIDRVAGSCGHRLLSELLGW